MSLNSIILGLSTGTYYSLVALGLVFVFRISKVVNFAFGNMGMFMVYIALSLIGIQFSPLMAFLTILPLAALFGYIVDKFTMRPIKHISHGSMLIITLGLMMVLEGLAVQIWGADYKAFPELIKGRPIILKLSHGIVVFRKQDILIFTLLVSISFVLFILFKFTKLGISIRATAQDEETAKLMGVNTNMISSFAWMVSTMLSTTVAILGAPKTYVSPSMMLFYQIEGFTAAVLGGFESFPGAIIGGLILGVLENTVRGFIGEEFKSALSLAIVVIVLLIKPEGLFGKMQKVKV